MGKLKTSFFIAGVIERLILQLVFIRLVVPVPHDDGNSNVVNIFGRTRLGHCRSHLPFILLLCREKSC